jgi:hypothetical protein
MGCTTVYNHVQEAFSAQTELGPVPRKQQGPENMSKEKKNTK